MNQIPPASSAGTRKSDMLYRQLGNTGEQVSAIGMGGFHIAQHPGSAGTEMYSTNDFAQSVGFYGHHGFVVVAQHYVSCAFAGLHVFRLNAINLTLSSVILLPRP